MIFRTLKVTMFFFLLCICNTMHGQSSDGCSMKYELEFEDTQKQSKIAHDFRIELDSEIIVEWSSLMGHVTIEDQTNAFCKIKCFGNTIQSVNEEIKYKRKLFCELMVNLNTCEVQKQMTLHVDVDTLKLFENYKYLLSKYHSKIEIDTLRAADQTELMMLAYYLMCGSLNGTKKCKKLFDDFLLDFPFMQYGLNGSDYLGWKLILRELI